MSHSEVTDEFILPKEAAESHVVSEKTHDHAAPHDYLSAVENGEDVPVPPNPLQRWVLTLERQAGVEARGIERVPESLRAKKTTLMDYVQMCLIWFSANLTANNLMVGLLGPLLFGLGLTDGMLLGTFGSLLGSAGAGYISTFGPISGNRTLVSRTFALTEYATNTRLQVIARYTMGWWPSRLCVLLNIVIMLGYGLIDILIAGQILSAVNGGGLTVIVGVIVAAIISLVIVVFGIRVFHTYERYAFLPQLIVLFILVGVAGPYFDTSSSTVGDSEVKAADRMSFFFLCVSGPLAWSPAAADFYVYFPPDAKRWKVFLSTTIGLGLSCVMANVLGVGIASGVPLKPEWNDAYQVSTGALFVQCFQPLGTFGHFCSVIMALGLIANNVPGTYSAALSFQLLGRWLMAIPRLFWTFVGVIIYTVCACAGRNKLYEVFQNFLALMGYWTAIWVAITLEEEFIFRRRRGGYNWEVWNDPKKLPIGLAALVAFCVGWVGAVLGMWQTYFTGPLARQVGDGIDLGMPVAASWGALTYPPLRWLELKYFGR